MTQLETFETSAVVAAVRTVAQRAALYVVDGALYVGVFMVYFLLRGLPSDRVGQSTDNALNIIDFEKALGIFREPAWQHAVLDNKDLVEVANFTYMNLHLPLLVVAGFVIFAVDPVKYRVLRNTILLSAFLAVPIYFLFPVTPPRLLEGAGHAAFGFVDTIPAEQRSKPDEISNWYAAMPSYHFGWIALLAAGTCWTFATPLIRVVAVGFAAFMWWAIVVTGNHYFVDMVAGAAMCAFTFWLVYRFERWAEANPERVARFTFRLGPLRLPF